eukprot:CAMPEP_0115705868 /NCGR_PEP_ID=MMETSP0272-20121206/70466_2 /TAXON_ID=71861 /ORGANISM="Scrippsiella trochoidea, Strain CCMP3099" /LENGTH=279 /DNA_ID=CAMNT_0003147037 /DNA_START=80 /DNA_END=921 /DNA_ORIENTATION=-
MSFAAEVGREASNARKAKAAEIVNQVRFACTQAGRDGKTSAEHKERVQDMSDEEKMHVKAEVELSLRDLGFTRVNVEYVGFPEWAFVIRTEWQAVGTIQGNHGAASSSAKDVQAFHGVPCTSSTYAAMVQQLPIQKARSQLDCQSKQQALSKLECQSKATTESIAAFARMKDGILLDPLRPHVVPPLLCPDLAGVPVLPADCLREAGDHRAMRCRMVAPDGARIHRRAWGQIITDIGAQLHLQPPWSAAPLARLEFHRIFQSAYPERPRIYRGSHGPRR